MTPATPDPIEFDIWGCRGSRNFVPRRSEIANLTSCYSLRVGPDLYVFDAGRGLAALGTALRMEERFRAVTRVHVLVTHAHMDHWEGLKDADWFWVRGNALEVEIASTEQGLATLRAGYEHPSYVPLDLLADGTVARLSYRTLGPGDATALAAGARLRTAALNHYSGSPDARRPLDTIGFRLEVEGGPVLAYLSDHEPGPDTLATELGLLDGAHLAVLDSHFADVRQHAHGHGSQEHTASLARRRTGTLILAGHHGPLFSDDDIRAAHARHAAGLPNFALAVEGTTYAWDGVRKAFDVRRP
jgi:phosphoribosyl 1,2-cyclic phosphodiesterase